MKKKLLIIASVLLTVILAGVAGLYIRGGEPKIDNYAEVSDDYGIIAQLALDTYSKYSPDDKYIIIDVYDGAFRYDDYDLPLNREQQRSVLTASESFDYLRVGFL